MNSSSTFLNAPHHGVHLRALEALPTKYLMGVYLEEMKVVLMVVHMQDLAEQVTTAEVMFQIQYPLLQNKILVKPPSY